MSESVAARGVSFAGPAGPESLRIPAEPAQLSQAVQQLRQLADSLTRAGDELAGAEGRHQERDGSTTATVLGVARWNGRRLRKDAALLAELADAADHEAQLLGDVQHHELPALRRRWEQARGDFLGAVRGAAKHEPDRPGAAAPDAHALMEHVDEQQVQQYADLFARLLGVQVPGGGGQGNAVFLDPRSEQAVASYRQAVRGVLDEFAELVQRVRQSERQVEEREAFPRTERDDEEGADVALVAAGGLVSAFPVLRELAKDLRTGAQALEQTADSVSRIAQALRDGQLPDRSREQEPGEGFRLEWLRHFERRRARLRTVSEKLDDVLDRFQRLDEECARAIRAH